MAEGQAAELIAVLERPAVRQPGGNDPLSVKPLDGVVARISHIEIALRVKRQAVGSVKRVRITRNAPHDFR